MNSNFIVQNTHPLIQREQTYVLNRKLVSIHSEDRDYVKWPNSNHFGIDLGQGYHNVESIRLVDYSFPSNNYTFSNEYQNTKLSFKYKNEYRIEFVNWNTVNNQQVKWNNLLQILQGLWNGAAFPEKPANVTVQLNVTNAAGILIWEDADITETNISNAIQTGSNWNTAFARLVWIPDEFTITIPEGYYTPENLTTTLETLMNQEIFNASAQPGYNFLPGPTSTTPSEYILPNTNISSAWYQQPQIGISPIKVKHDKITNKILFGSTEGIFVLNFEKQEQYTLNCNVNKSVFSQFTKWGLPSYLGFDRLVYRGQLVDLDSSAPDNNWFQMNQGGLFLPYEPNTPWLVPTERYTLIDGGLSNTITNASVTIQNLPTYQVAWVGGIMNLNIQGEDAIYMEMDRYNNIDEIYPYSIKTNNLVNNDLGHRSNGSFAKLPIINNPFKKTHGPENSFITNLFHSSPPTQKIDKLEFKFRYHDGRLVDFKNLPFSFTLEFNMLRDEQQRGRDVRVLSLYNI